MVPGVSILKGLVFWSSGWAHKCRTNWNNVKGNWNSSMWSSQGFEGGDELSAGARVQKPYWVLGALLKANLSAISISQVFSAWFPETVSSVSSLEVSPSAEESEDFRALKCNETSLAYTPSMFREQPSTISSSLNQSLPLTSMASHQFDSFLFHSSSAAIILTGGSSNTGLLPAPRSP